MERKYITSFDSFFDWLIGWTNVCIQDGKEVYYILLLVGWLIDCLYSMSNVCIQDEKEVYYILWLIDWLIDWLN